MKKSLFSLVAVAGMLFATSCSSDIATDFSPTDGEEVEVTFDLELPQDYASRATTLSELNKYRLVYRVYDANGNELASYPLSEPSADHYTANFNTSGTYSLSNQDGNVNRNLRFIKGQTYQIAFWAQYVDLKSGYVNGTQVTATSPFINDAYDYSDLRAVKVDYSKIANNDKIVIGTNKTNGEVKEYYDAFFAAEKFTVVNSSQTIKVTLRRPFAQVNVGVTEEEWNRAVQCDYKVAETKAVLPAYNTLNILDGSVSGFETVTYDFAEIPSLTDGVENDKRLSVTTYANKDGVTTPTTTDYIYLSKNYILAPSAKTTDPMEFTFRPEVEAFDDYVLTQGLSATPYQRNFRTNILLNNFLTGTVTFTINIDPLYGGDFNSTNGGSFGNQIAEGVGYDMESETFYITDKAGLNWFRNQVNAASYSALLADITVNGTFKGKTVMLMTDIDLANANGAKTSIVPIADPLTNPTVDHNFAGTFDGGNHTIRNFTITKNYNANNAKQEYLAGFFAKAVGGTIKNLKLQDATITSSHFAGVVVAHGMCTTIDNCHVENVTVTSNPWKNAENIYDDGNGAGAISGYLSAENEASITNCTVKKAVIKAYRDVGGVVGIVGGANAIVQTNTISDVDIIANQFIGTYVKATEVNANKIYGRVTNGATGNSNGSTLNGKTNTVLNNVFVKVYAPDSNGNFDINEKTDITDLPNLVGGGETGLQSVTLTSDVTGDARKGGYSNVGIYVSDVDIDGGGYTLNVTNASTTWDTAIYTTGGKISNLNITGAFRGIFTGGVTSNIVVEDVVIKGTRFTFSSDAGNLDYGVYFTRTKLYGWTSYTSKHKEVKFTDCVFGKGEGWADADNGIDYAFCRPYTETWFYNCDFEEGFELDTNQAKVHLVNCRLNGVDITTKNIKTLCPAESVQGGILKGYNMYVAANVSYTE